MILRAILQREASKGHRKINLRSTWSPAHRVPSLHDLPDAGGRTVPTQRIKLGERAVGWLESEVRAWLATRIEPAVQPTSCELKIASWCNYVATPHFQPSPSATFESHFRVLLSARSFRKVKHWRRHSAAKPARRVSGTQISTGRKPAARRAARCFWTR
jgi:hypothetical protein